MVAAHFFVLAERYSNKIDSSKCRHSVSRVNPVAESELAKRVRYSYSAQVREQRRVEHQRAEAPDQPFAQPFVLSYHLSLFMRLHQRQKCDHKCESEPSSEHLLTGLVD